MPAKRSSAKIDAKRIVTEDKRRQVLELRSQRLTWEEIAKQVGFAGPGSAKKSYDKALKAITSPAAAQVRAEFDIWFWSMMRVFGPKALDGDVKSSELLRGYWKDRVDTHGARVPVRQEHSGPDGGPIPMVDVGTLNSEQLEQVLRFGFQGLGRGGTQAQGESGAGAPQEAPGDRGGEDPEGSEPR